MHVGSAAFAQYAVWGQGYETGSLLLRPLSEAVGPSLPAPLPFAGCPSQVWGTGRGWAGEGVLQRLGGAWEYSQKCQIGETAYLFLGTGQGRAWLLLPPTLLPAPTHALPGEGGQGTGGTQLPPVRTEKFWLDAFPRAPRLTGCGRPSDQDHSRWAFAQGLFVTRRWRWCCGRGPGFLGSRLDCGSNTSASHVYLFFF